MAGEAAASGGGAPAAGQAPAPAAPVARAKIGDFGGFSAGVPIPEMLTSEPPAQQRGQVAERTESDPFDHFAQVIREGEDAQGQSIEPYEDPNPAQVLQPDEQEQYEQWRKSHDEYEAFKVGDNIPDAFMDKFIPVTVDGETYRVSAREAALGYQRERDYSNGKRALAAYEQQLIRRENGLKAFLADLDRGETFLDAMVALKKFKGFHEAAMIYGRQLDAERRMTPEQRAVYAANRQLQQENKQLARERMALQHQLSQQPQPQQQNANTDRIMHQLAQLLPKAAAITGFVDGELSRQAFEMHMDRLLPEQLKKGGEVDTPFIVTVMRAAQQEVDVMVRASEARRVQQGGQPNLPPSPGTGAAPAPNIQGGAPRANGRPVRAKIGSFSAEVGRR